VRERAQHAEEFDAAFKYEYTIIDFQSTPLLKARSADTLGLRNSTCAHLFQEAEETAAEERAMEARSMPVWLEGKSRCVDGTRPVIELTILESTLADLTSGSDVFLRSHAGASGEFGFLSGLF